MSSTLYVIEATVVNRKYRIFCLVLGFLFPSLCFANGGGPLLLIVSGSAFVLGQVWIQLSETLVLKNETGLSLSTSFGQVFLINLASTLVVGIGLPLLLAIVTAFGMELPKPWGGYMSLLGTWLYDRAPYIKLTPWVSMAWLLVTFVLTAIFEKKLLLKMWAKKQYRPAVSINRLIVKMHFLSYSGLFAAVLYFWRDFFVDI